MNSPLPRRFYYLLLVFGVLAGTLFAAATFFFPERSVERISAYLILTMGTCVLICAIGLTLTHRWMDQHFAARESGHGPDTEFPLPPASASASASTSACEQTVLKPPPQIDDSAAGKTKPECVVSTTN